MQFNNIKSTTTNKQPSLTETTTITIIDRESTFEADFAVNTQTNSRIDISENAGAATAYCKKLAERVCGIINSVEFKTQLGQDTYVKFHRTGDAPTAITVPSLTSRSVVVNMNDPYSTNTMPTKMTAYAGSSIVSQPVDKAVLISMVHEKFDSECDGVITELTLRQESQQLLMQLDREIATKLIQALESEDSAGTKYFTKLSQPVLPAGPMLTTFEAIEEGIYQAIGRMTQFGSIVEDFIVTMSPKFYAIAERAARRSGHDNVEDFLGAAVYQHFPTGDDLGELFVLPKALVAVSFREDSDGTVILPTITRKASRQSTVIEFTGVIDLICAGFTKVVNEGDTTHLMNVKLPLVTKVVFDKNR